MSWKLSALKHAHACYPEEACGLVVLFKGRERFVPCKNLASEPRRDFVIGAEEYAAAADMGEIKAVFHSHPDASASPSPADRMGCQKSGLTWHIVSMPGAAWFEMEPDAQAPSLFGRVFQHGHVDCYSFIRDWYSKERGIQLLDFSRPDDWWERGMNLYLEGFPRAGFTEVDPASMQEGDVLLMQIESPVPNHAAIYLGGDVIAHHLYGRLSSRDVYSGYYRHVTTNCLRYAA